MKRNVKGNRDDDPFCLFLYPRGTGSRKELLSILNYFVNNPNLILKLTLEHIRSR